MILHANIHEHAKTKRKGEKGWRALTGEGKGEEGKEEGGQGGEWKSWTRPHEAVTVARRWPRRANTQEKGDR